MSKTNNNKKKGNNKWILWIVIAIVVIAAVSGILYYRWLQNKEKEITYDQLYQDILDKKVEKIEMTIGGSSVTVKYKDTAEGEEKVTKINLYLS